MLWQMLWLKEENMSHLAENISHLGLLNQIRHFFWLWKSTALLYRVSCTCRKLSPTICITEHSGERVWREASVYIPFSALSHIPRRLCSESLTCRKDSSLLHNSHSIKPTALRKQLPISSWSYKLPFVHIGLFLAILSWVYKYIYLYSLKIFLISTYLIWFFWVSFQRRETRTGRHDASIFLLCECWRAFKLWIVSSSTPVLSQGDSCEAEKLCSWRALAGARGPSVAVMSSRTDLAARNSHIHYKLLCPDMGQF